MKRLILIFLIISAGPTFSFISFPKKSLEVRKVIIDAGHGGQDPGNLGTGRYESREKDVALDVALKVGKYIKANFEDVEVIFTRKNDRFLELRERTALANRKKADLFISIHCDAHTNAKAHGSSTFVMGKDHSDKNMRVAKKENSVIFLEENYEEKYEGFDPNVPETYIALTLYQNAFLDQSISFANKVQTQFRDRVKRKDRGVKQQPLWVTSRTVMPSVLIELGFLTNHNEEDFLNSEKGQDYMASAIYRAFKAYKNEREGLNQVLDIDTIAVVPEPESELEAKENKVVFSVQIATSMETKELIPGNFKGVEDVKMRTESGIYKFTVGETDNYKEAVKLQKRMRKLGFKDAFVVAFVNDVKITVQEALQLLK